MISSAMTRWASTDLEQLVSPPTSHQAWLQSQGLEEGPAHTRQWIVWHVLEHETQHGGELSLALGAYGLESFYTWRTSLDLACFGKSPSGKRVSSSSLCETWRGFT